MHADVPLLQREQKNNQLEVTLCYCPGNAEEGETDALTVGVTKLRWSVETTLEYEQKNGLYRPTFICYKSSQKRRFSPNVAVQWLALLLRIQEVPGANLGPETDYPDIGFPWFSSIRPGNC
jgi:hypothetical protein